MKNNEYKNDNTTQHIYSINLIHLPYPNQIITAQMLATHILQLAKCEYYLTYWQVHVCFRY